MATAPDRLQEATPSLRQRGQQAFERFWRLAGAVSVRMKILGIVLALVLLLGVGATLQVRAMSYRALVAGLQEQSVATGRDVAARATDLILINDLYTLQRLLEETQEHNPDVRYVFVVDERGQVLAHTFGQGFPAGLLEANTAGQHHHDPVRRMRPVWIGRSDSKRRHYRVGPSEQRQTQCAA